MVILGVYRSAAASHLCCYMRMFNCCVALLLISVMISSHQAAHEVDKSAHVQHIGSVTCVIVALLPTISLHRFVT